MRSSSSEALLVENTGYYSGIVRNDGSIRALNGPTFFTNAVSIPNFEIINNGRVSAYSTLQNGHVTGVIGGGINNGVISAITANGGRAVGWDAGNAINNGLVEATSTF